MGEFPESVSDEDARVAEMIIRESVVIDLTLPWFPDTFPYRLDTLDEYKASGFDVVGLTLALDEHPLDRTMRAIASETARFKQEPEKYVLVRNVNDMSRARTEDKLGVLFHFQGTAPLEGQLPLVETYYDLGIRYMLLAYNLRNEVADGCHERTDGGLSAFGADLIKEMNRVGMIVDCTHTGYRSTMEAMELSAVPCIFSHSVSRVLVDRERNIWDDQIKMCASTGGVIGINGVGMFISDDNHATVEAMFRHTDYVVQLVGPDHVAIGLDYVFYLPLSYQRVAANRHRWPQNPEPPYEFLPPGALGEYVARLVAAGYRQEDIKAILGENVARVAAAVWRE